MLACHVISLQHIQYHAFSLMSSAPSSHQHKSSVAGTCCVCSWAVTLVRRSTLHQGLAVPVLLRVHGQPWSELPASLCQLQLLADF